MILSSDVNKQIKADALQTALTTNFNKLKMSSFEMYDKLDSIEESLDAFTNKFKEDPTAGFLDTLGFNTAIDSQSWQFDNFAEDVNDSIANFPKKCQNAIGSKISQYANDAQSTLNDTMSQFEMSGLQNQLGGLGKDLLAYQKLVESLDMSSIVGDLDSLLNCSMDFLDFLDMDLLSDIMDFMTDFQMDTFLDDLGNFDMSTFLNDKLSSLTSFLETSIDDIANAVGDFFNDVIGNVTAMVDKVIDEAISQVTNMVGKVGDIINNIKSQALEFLDKFLRIQSDAQKLQEKWF